MDTNKIIREQLNLATSPIKEIVKNRPWYSTLQEIKVMNNLTEDQITNVENEIIFVLLSMELLSNFSQNIQSQADLSKSQADEISNSLYENLFKNLEQYLPSEIETKPQPQERGSSQPIIITPETKKAVIAELSQRVEAAKVAGGTIKPVAPSLPMVEPGEVAHEVPHVEKVVEPEPIKIETKVEVPLPKPVEPVNTEEKKKPEINFPKSGYEDGKDPYREPIA